MSDAISPDAPRPRLCHLKKAADFVGYGFNLHAEKGKAGQYIGAIDPGSPAERAGLKSGDRIVEVNGTNIGNENHQQVVQRIRSVDDETRLLVVDLETDKFYKDNKIVVRGDLPNVQYVSSETSPTNGTADIDTTSEHDQPDHPEADKPVIRRCILHIWPDFQGYGFNLHAEKGKPGQFIGKVDENSPAEYAGLKEGDRLVEVNGSSVSSESHSQVVTRIKSVSNQVELLVADAAADSYYKETGETLHSGQPFVKVIECPHTRPSTRENSVNEVEADIVNNTAELHLSNGDEDVQQSQAELVSTIDAVEKAIELEEEKEMDKAEEKEELNNNRDVADNYDTIESVGASEQEATTTFEENHQQDYEPVDLSVGREEGAAVAVVETKAAVFEAPSEPAPIPHVEQPTTPTSPTVVGGIEFASSAAAAREKVQGRRKRDAAKSQNMSAKDKYDMFMKL